MSEQNKTAVISDSSTTTTDSTISNVVVHPLVLLSCVDHFNRVAKDTKKRVVGVLLGEKFKNKGTHILSLIHIIRSY